MRKFTLLSAALALAACESPSAPEVTAEAAAVTALRTADQTFVLSSAENQRSAPIVTLDLRCPTGRIQSQIRDSIFLRADGSARRAFVLEQIIDGRVNNSWHNAAVGTWEPYTRSDAWYYKDGPSIQLNLANESGVGGAYKMWFRLSDPRVLTTMTAMGGSCPGFSDKARHAEFGYTRE
jgi:hypothetical protein